MVVAWPRPAPPPLINVCTMPEKNCLGKYANVATITIVLTGNNTIADTTAENEITKATGMLRPK